MHLLAEYERVVTPLHGSAGDGEMTLHGSSGDTEIGRRIGIPLLTTLYGSVEDEEVGI